MTTNVPRPPALPCRLRISGKGRSVPRQVVWLPPALTVLLLWLVTAAPSFAEGSESPPAGDWPQWRGPGGLGISTASDLPETWDSEGTGQCWKTALPGSGNSSPIVSSGVVFLTTAEGKPQSLERKVLALNFDTGEILWTRSIAKYPGEKIAHNHTTWAAPTPATDGQLVFAYFGSHLAALTFDGRIVWDQEVDPAYASSSRYGAASSPVLSDDAVIVFQDREWAADQTEDKGWLASFDKATGKENWRIQWGNSCCSYVTPFLLGHSEILLTQANRVSVHGVGSGEQLWGFKQTMNQPVAGPVTEDDLLCVASGADHVRSASCRRLRGRGKETEVETLWETSIGVPSTSSPLLFQGLLYMLAENGILTCYDARSGESLWRIRLATGRYLASLVAGDGKVYASNSNGLTTVLAVGPELRKITENRLRETAVTASPALTDGRILLRAESYLYCLGKPPTEPPKPGGDEHPGAAGRSAPEE